MDLQSTSISEWFHTNVCCRYGIPACVRSDKGKEFAGSFDLYLQRMGVTHRVINTTNPRSNGLAERYVGMVKAGFRKFATACGGTWFEHVGDICAGLRFLPSRVGISPFLLCYKQEPQWLTERVGPVAAEVNVEPTDADVEHLLGLQLKWWDVMIAEVRQRLQLKDKQMRE